MRKIFALLIFVCLILSSCSIDWNDEKDNKIAELEKQLKDDAFIKNQECAKLRKEVLSTLSTEYIEGMVKITDSFYSKKTNSCLYRAGLYKDVLEEGYFNDLISERIYDYFSNKNIVIYSNESQKIEYVTNEDFNKLEEKIKELK